MIAFVFVQATSSAFKITANNILTLISCSPLPPIPWEILMKITNVFGMKRELLRIIFFTYLHYEKSFIADSFNSVLKRCYTYSPTQYTHSSLFLCAYFCSFSC